MNPRSWSARTRALGAGAVAVVVAVVVVVLATSGGSSNRVATTAQPQATSTTATATASTATRKARRRPRPISPRAQARSWIRSFAGAARRARARIVALEREVGSAPTAYDPVASAAQTAQNALQALTGRLASQHPSGNSRLGGAESGFSAAATSLRDQMGDFIGYARRNAHLGSGGPGRSARAGTHARGGPPPEQAPSVDPQFKRQWNGAVRTIWRIAHQSNPPTI